MLPFRTGVKNGGLATNCSLQHMNVELDSKNVINSNIKIMGYGTDCFDFLSLSILEILQFTLIMKQIFRDDDIFISLLL